MIKLTRTDIPRKNNATKEKIKNQGPVVQKPGTENNSNSDKNKNTMMKVISKPNSSGDKINRYNDTVYVKYTHCEFHPSMMLGSTSSCIPSIRLKVIQSLAATKEMGMLKHQNLANLF